MKKITISTGEILVVDTPKDACDSVIPNIGIVDLYFRRKGEYAEEESYVSVGIPQGDWQLLGLLSEITEKKVKDVMPCSEVEGEYQSYKEHFTNPYFFSFDSAIDSFKSLMQANDVKLFTNPVILFKPNK